MPMMTEPVIERLRVLIANERRDRLELLAQIVASLGHEVVARETDVAAVGGVTTRENPDVALVGLGLSSEHCAGPDRQDRSRGHVPGERFAEYYSLKGAFGRRASIEQAKGILMERYGIDADSAFERLRVHSAQSGQKIAEIATAIVESHALLPGAGEA